jgi:hypothetical protein
MSRNWTRRCATRQPLFLLPDTATPLNKWRRPSLPTRSRRPSLEGGREIVTERTRDEEHEEQPNDEPADNDGAGSSVDQAKEREREMEESGEENAG